MSDTIDLTLGEPDPDESPAARRRRERRERDSSSGSSSRTRSSTGGSSKSDDSSLVTRLDTAFVKLADQMLARGDDELAEALREERHAMSQGLVSLTATLTVLRFPLIVFMSLIEPVLAFWRVGRILIMRFFGWRERRIIAAQEAQAEWERQQQEAGAVA